MASIVTSSEIPTYSVDLRIRHGLKDNLTPQDLNAPRMLFFDDTKEVAVSQGDGTYLNISQSLILVRQYLEIMSDENYVPDKVLDLFEEQERIIEIIERMLGITEGSGGEGDSTLVDRVEEIEQKIKDLTNLDIYCNLTDDEFVGRLWS